MTDVLPARPLALGGTYSIGRLSSRRLLAYAGAAPRDTSDPVLVALRRAALDEGLELIDVDPADISPATAELKYGLARLHGIRTPGTDEHGDLIVMRGDLDTMLAVVPTTREERTTLRRNATMTKGRAGRPFGIATSVVHSDGSTEPFRMEGYISIRPAAPGAEAGSSRPVDWVRVNVWSATLRWMHWLNVVAIVLLTFTGYYILDPWFGPGWNGGVETGWLMGWIRAIHFVAAGLWITIGLIRVSLMFFSRNRYLRWPALWPLQSRADLGHLGGIIKEYAFINRHGPLYIAHNPLQQLAYTAIYALCAVQMATGMSLYGLFHQTNWFWQLWAMPAHWFGIATLRLVHAIVMWIIWAFVVIHVYLCFRADSVERHGSVSAMINGGVWLQRGSKPVDGPKV